MTSNDRSNCLPQGEKLEHKNAIVAVFPDHNAAESAVKKLTAADFDMKNLSVIGKGFHTEEKVIGFYKVGDRINFWGFAERSGAGCGAFSSAAFSSQYPSLVLSFCLDLSHP